MCSFLLVSLIPHNISITHAAVKTTELSGLSAQGWLNACLSTCLFVVCLFVCLFVCLTEFVCLFVCSFVCLFVRLFNLFEWKRGRM